MRLLATLFLVFASLGLTAQAAQPAMPVDMTMGKPKAKVEIVEYASLSCPHCAHVNETLIPQLKAKYIDTGKARLVLREMMTPPTEVAAAGWLLARCSGPKNYFNVVDQVFRSQSKWRDGDLLAIFQGIGAANGVDKTRFDACLRDRDALASLNARAEAAAAAGVTSTPTFFVNGKRLDGELSMATFDAAIAEASKGGGRR